MSLSNSAIRRLARELTQLGREPPEGIRVVVNEDDVSNFWAWVQGPSGTPYEGGYFKIRFDLTASNWPTTPPKAWFVTKAFHPNLEPRTGEICVNTLKKDWRPEMTIEHVLLTIKTLLMTPNYDSALNEEAGRMLLESQEDFARQAALFTKIHASARPAEFAILASTSVAPTKSSSGVQLGSSKDLSCTTRSNSLDPVPFPQQTMPLQESASGNGATPPTYPIDIAAGKKRTISNALGSTGSSSTVINGPEPKKAAASAAAKKRGLKRL